MSDTNLPDDIGFEELDRLWDLAVAAVREDDAKRTALDLERCRHGFTAGEYCDACDDESP